MSSQPAGAAPAGSETPAAKSSIGLTIVMILLVLLAIAGAIFAVLGLGGADPIDIKIGDDFTLKTQSVGFGVMALALLALVGIVKFMPAHVTPYAGGGATAARGVPEQVKRAQRPITLSGIAALVVAVIIAIVNH